MPRTFTIFNHGTDFHRDKNAVEVVSVLSGEGAAGTEARIMQYAEPTKENPLPYMLETQNPSFLICEGPGSEEVQANTPGSSGVHHAHPGKYNPLTGGEKKPATVINPAIKAKPRRLLGLRGPDTGFQDDFMGNTAQPWQVSGRVLGRGWDDNVYMAAWLISHLNMEMNMGVDTINIVGWSRGAVTCLKMANKLYEVYDETIKVNIFAIDPVPGGFTSETPDMKIIPPNVTNYLAILALDDNRANFQPLDKTRVGVLIPKQRKSTPALVHFLPLPGNHSNVVIPGKGPVSASYSLCLHLAWKYLKHHGTQFKPGFEKNCDLSVKQIIKLYNDLMQQREAIANAASSGLIGIVGGRKMERAVRAHRELYVLDSETFLNEHHRQCCLLPNLTGVQRQPSEYVVKAYKEKDVMTHHPIQAFLHDMGISY